MVDGHHIEDPFADPVPPAVPPDAPRVAAVEHSAPPARQRSFQAAVEAAQVINDYDPPAVLVKPPSGKGQASEIDLEAVMIHVENGGTINEVAKEIDAKHWKRVQGRIMRMIASTKETQRRYEVATINRATLWSDEAVKLAEEDCTVEVFNGAGKSLGRKTDSGKVHQLRLMIETRKWAVEHLLSKYANREQERELGDALSTLVRGLASAGRPGQTALPMVQRVDEVEG